MEILNYKVPIVKLSEFTKSHPEISGDYLNDLVSKVELIDGVNCITLFHALLILKLYNLNIRLDDIFYTDATWCSVCNEILLPDDEAYEDANTGEQLCTTHARFDDELNGYVTTIS